MQIPLGGYLKGIGTRVPGLRRLACRYTGGTSSTRYCFGLWFRHLSMISRVEPWGPPKAIAELGPGDSLGAGICAMLCGVERYSAFDVRSYASGPKHQAMLQALAAMLRRDEAVPDAREFPNLAPDPSLNLRPSMLVGADRLMTWLEPARISRIEQSLLGDLSQEANAIRYLAPWTEHRFIADADGVDLIYSQAVLEHVDDLEVAYRAMASALRPGGLMSHTIDFQCHGITRDWFGHWTIGSTRWSFVRGNRAYFINRMPWSYHRQRILEAGFDILFTERRSGQGPRRRALAKPFNDLCDDEDLSTIGMYVLARKR